MTTEWDKRLAELRAEYAKWREAHPLPDLPGLGLGPDVGPLYYDPEGQPIDQPLWGMLLAERAKTADHPETWWCKKTEIGDTHVSTVWLGLNHNYHPEGPPLIWETMIFGGKWDQEQWRYHTRAQAYDHHEEIVRALRTGKDPNEQ